MSKTLSFKDRYRLLHIIDKGENVDNLANEYGYVNLAIEIRNMITDGAVINDGTRFELTDKGKAQKDHLGKVVLMRGKGWIIPKDDEKMTPISEDDIYLPTNIKF